MNWDAIGAIGQAVSALALIFVIVQVRHATAESKRALSQGRAEAAARVNAFFLDHRVASAWAKAVSALAARSNPTPASASARGPMATLMEQAELTEEEAFTVLTIARTMWSNILHLIPNVEQLPAIERREFETTIRREYGANGPNRIFYERYVKRHGHPDAIRYIDSVLAQPVTGT